MALRREKEIHEVTQGQLAFLWPRGPPRVQVVFAFEVSGQRAACVIPGTEVMNPAAYLLGPAPGRMGEQREVLVGLGRLARRLGRLRTRRRGLGTRGQERLILPQSRFGIVPRTEVDRAPVYLLGPAPAGVRELGEIRSGLLWLAGFDRGDRLDYVGLPRRCPGMSVLPWKNR